MGIGCGPSRKGVFLLESLFYSTDEQVTGEDAFAVD